jgi:SAM-dependent methyltransferase
MFMRLLRKVRHKLIGLDGIMYRLDTLQSNLNALSASVTAAQKCFDTEKHRLRCAIDGKSNYATHVPLPVVRLQPNESVRVAFIVQHASVWSSWRSVWLAAHKDQRFYPKVVLTPFLHPYSSMAVTYDDLKQLLINENVPFCTVDYFDVNLFKPHVTFIQNPYEETRPENLRIDRLRKAGTRIAYIPYGLELGGGAWNISVQYDSILHRSAWRVFARSERHKTMFGKYCRVGNDHVHVVGHPKFDLPNKRICDCVSTELKGKIAGRKVLLWTPHFSVGDPPAWSTFNLYCGFILSEMGRRSKLFLLIRPHPLFFKAMRQNKLWDSEGEKRFRDMVKESGNLGLDECSDYSEAFSISNALMTDVGSFLLEYLPTKKPLLYLHHPDGPGMSDDGEIVRFLYTAACPKDIANFMEMLSLGEDPMRIKREQSVPMFLDGLDKNVGEHICQHIYLSVNAEDHWSPDLFQQRTIEQSSSEDFWSKSTCTFLAPDDYYERKEKILYSVLSKQTRFRTAIDIGCGDGRFTFILAKYTDEVTGYDISPVLIEKARNAFAHDNAGSGKFTFKNQEIDMIVPHEKYDLVSCMGVTSCIIDDIKFLSILDKFRLLSKPGSSLLLIDTLSLEQEKIVSDHSGYIAKYRNMEDYLNLIVRRGYDLKEKILLSEDADKKLINQLFLFVAEDFHIPRLDSQDEIGKF